MRRKILSLVLALCMVISLLPMTAFAANSESITVDDIKDGAETISSTSATWADNAYSIVLDSSDTEAKGILGKISNDNVAIFDSTGTKDENVTPSYTTESSTLTLTFKNGALEEAADYYIEVAGDSSNEYVAVSVAAYTKGSDADLSNLTATGFDLTFAAGTTTYTAEVANSVESVTVTPTVKDAKATVTVNDKAATSGQASTVNLIEGSNTITIKVTAEDGTTTKTYTITITRAGADTPEKDTLTAEDFTYTAPASPTT